MVMRRGHSTKSAQIKSLAVDSRSLIDRSVGRARDVYPHINFTSLLAGAHIRYS
jgi:hypothetical protein